MTPTPNAPGTCPTKSALARYLGVRPDNITRWSKKPWFPAPGPGGYDGPLVRAAIIANNPRGLPGTRTAPAAPVIQPDDPLLVTLMRGTSDPIDITRAAVQLAARTYAHGLSAGTVGARDLDHLKHACEELRKAEDDYLDLAIRRGELIEKDAAAAVAGALARRMVNIIETAGVALATQVLIWLESKPFAAEKTEDQKRAVRAWFAGRARELLETEATQIEQLLKTESEDRKRGA